MFNHENFSYKNFVDHVLEKMHLQDTPEPLKTKITKEILQILGDRVLYATSNAMSDENLSAFETIREANPHLTVFEVLFMLVDEIPVLSEVMIKHINDLAQELVYDADRLDNALAERAKAESKQSK